MNTEVKLPFYLLLIYLFYALFSWVEIGDFVPPIFIMPVIISMVGLFYVIKNIKSMYVLLYLSFSFVFTLNLNPFLNNTSKDCFWIVSFICFINVCNNTYQKLSQI